MCGGFDFLGVNLNSYYLFLVCFKFYYVPASFFLLLGVHSKNCDKNIEKTTLEDEN